MLRELNRVREVERTGRNGGAAAPGEDDDRQPRVEAGVDPVGPADRPQDVEPRGVGQGQVEQQRLGRRLPRGVRPHF